IVGLVQGLRSPRRRLFVTLLWVVAVYIAIYLPTTVEARFGVAALVLLSIPAAYALGAGIQPGTLRRDALLAVPICLGILGACFLSSWMQGQAALIADARDLLQRQAAGQDVKPEGRLAVGPPATWRAGAKASYPIEIRNTSQRLWQATRLHPVMIRVTFSPRFGDEDAADVTDVPLERDVAPGESLRMTVSTSAPAKPGMYALQHSLIRLGVSGATPSTAHEVEVAHVLMGAGDQSDVAAAPVEKPVAKVEATAPTTWRTGERQTYTIAVRNDGKQTWWRDRGYAAAIGITFAKRDEKSGKPGREITQLIPLPEDVGPGATAVTTASVEAPKDAGQYVLRHWIRREGSGWSEPSSESTVTVQAER
ncbi:MAG: hypothetical protein IT305_05715, partial [Chloroflexi bacterium]|nr:hypothetical protein [Chloroflexota bacterium]